MIGEICSSNQQAVAYSWFTFGGSAGIIIGPLLGGILSNPAERYPQIFNKSGLFGRFPYLLPCSCTAVFALLFTMLSAIFLQDVSQSS